MLDYKGRDNLHAFVLSKPALAGFEGYIGRLNGLFDSIKLRKFSADVDCRFTPKRDFI